MAGDSFDTIIGRYLVPIAELGDGAGDAFYFLRKNKSFVFTQGYCHPPGGIYCKIIYYPDDADGWLNIHGRRYGTTIKRLVNGSLELVPHDQQLRRHFEIDPTLNPNEKLPCWAEYHVRLPLSEFVGYFDHRKSLRVAMEIFPQVRDSVREASEVLEVPVEKLGCTGSLSYGKLEEPADDVDLCIYGTIAQNQRVIDRIRTLVKEPSRRVVEFGKFWPMRFYHGPLMICPFFEYLDPEEIPLRTMEVEVLRENVKAAGRVKDDTHSIYMPVLLTLDRVTIDGERHEDITLIIYDGSLRGEYYRGDSLAMSGARLVRVRERGKAFPALLVTVSPQIAKIVPGRPDGR
jgi:hypothetical protein